MAFLDLQPATSRATLVVPRAHASALADLEDPTTAPRCGRSRRAWPRRCAPAGLADGVNFLLADGVAAGQEVWHVHLHVLPAHAAVTVCASSPHWPRPSREVLT